MRQRCLNPNNHAYADYGGRGIAVDSAWDSFEQFFADMGPRPAGMTLERVDNSKGYGASNCKWATATEQARNRRPRRRRADLAHAQTNHLEPTRLAG